MEQHELMKRMKHVVWFLLTLITTPYLCVLAFAGLYLLYVGIAGMLKR